MFEVVFALLMYMNGKLEGYSPKANIADCLEKKRKVERDQGTNVNWSCKEVKRRHRAELPSTGSTGYTNRNGG